MDPYCGSQYIPIIYHIQAQKLRTVVWKALGKLTVPRHTVALNCSYAYGMLHDTLWHKIAQNERNGDSKLFCLSKCHMYAGNHVRSGEHLVPLDNATTREKKSERAGRLFPPSPRRKNNKKRGASNGKPLHSTYFCIFCGRTIFSIGRFLIIWLLVPNALQHVFWVFGGIPDLVTMTGPAARCQRFSLWSSSCIRQFRRRPACR